jgi:hypothetical protein
MRQAGLRQPVIMVTVEREQVDLWLEDLLSFASSGEMVKGENSGQ